MRNHPSKFRSLDHVFSVIHYSAVLLFAVPPLTPEPKTVRFYFDQSGRA